MIINATAALKTVITIQGALKVLTALHLTTYQYPEQTCVFDGATFDYIIVGGGTAGCVIANRLVEDNKTSVLLIEAGDDPQIEAGLPGLMLYTKQSGAAWNYTTEKDGMNRQCHKQLKDQTGVGRVLGGTSAVGYIQYSSGNRYDYQEWAKKVNDDTWSWENVLPYLKKSQKLKDPVINNAPDGQFYGTNGNLEITPSRFNMRKKYMKAFEERGNDIVTSVNGNNSLGYTDMLYTIGDGVRQSSAYSYLVPLRDNPNLHVLKNTIVKRIVFDAFKNAVGVEAYTEDKRYIIIKSRKEVIVSAGAFESPKLLMLSGVGPRNHLYSHKIATISDLPVGKNLQDHLSTILIINMTKLVIPYRPWNPHKYPAAVLAGYVSLNKSSQYPDYSTIIYYSWPKLCINYCAFTYSFKDEICDNIIGTDVNSEMMFSVVNKLKSKSRGEILLKSHDFKDYPLIYTNYYTEKEDLEDHARITEDFIKILDTETLKKLGATFQDPKLPSCQGLKPGTREYWKCYVQCMSDPQHHYAGTCAMGSVVDARLRVYGVRKLRVADASVMPHPPAGGTLGPTIMIGEKVADMIIEDNKVFRPFLRYV